jgi:peptidoglycan/xylan/chitin deacetylase (PgdA/CDA1 family)
LHIPLHLLEAAVEIASAVGTIVPLREFVPRHLEGRGTAGLVALTADDAYASLQLAEPFLRRRTVPMTVFAVSEALAYGQVFWWDRLEDLFPHASSERWRCFEDECGLPETYRLGQPTDEGPLRPMRQWLLAAHAGRWPTEVEEALARLEVELGRRTAQRSMTDVELAAFVDRTGAEVGIHTISHPVLPLLSDREVVREIACCHEALRARFPEVLPYLAIPFGLFDARTLRLAIEAGVTSSLTLAGTQLRPEYEPTLGLPRICLMREYSVNVLALKLSGVAELLNLLRGRKTSPYPLLPSATT